MGIFGDAWDWTKDAWGSVTGAVDDTFSAEQVKDPNRKEFYLGGDPSAAGNIRAAYDQNAQAGRNLGTAAQGRTGPVGDYRQANLDYANQRGARDSQMANADRLAAFGQRPQGPSAAQAQLQQGTDRTMAANLALANSGRGMGDSAEAMRRAQFANSTALSETANNAAQLRAQEDAQYRQQQLSALGAAQDAYSGVRGADLGARGQSQGQAQAGVQAELQQRGMNDSMQQFGMSNALAYDQMGYGTYRDELQAAKDYEQLKMQGALGNQQGDIAKDGQTLGTVQSIGGAMAMMSDIKAKTNIRPAQVTNTRPAQPSKWEKFGQALMGSGNRMMMSDRNSKEQIRALESELAATKAALGGGPATGNVRPRAIDTDALDAAYEREGGTPNLRGAQAYKYRYKDPDAYGAGEGEYVGPMAQDLEHLPGVVDEGPRGKMVDPNRLTMVNTSAIGELQNRLDRVEAENIRGMRLGEPPATSGVLGPRAAFGPSEDDEALSRELAAGEQRALARIRGGR